MRPWLLLLLLLVSLLVSDLSPLGDGDWVMENYSWSLCRNLLLNGRMTPRGPRILWSQTESHCSLRPGKGKTVPAFPLKSDTLRALRAISEITSIKAGRESSHIPMDAIKDLPDSGSAWILHHHTADSGHNFQAFLLKKSKSWAPATAVRLQKTLTKPCCEIFSCRLKKGEIRSALKIPKQQMAPPQIRQKGATQRAMDIKVLEERRDSRPPKASAGQQNSFQAAGSSSVRSSDISQLKIHINAVRIMKKNEHLNRDKEPSFHRNVQRQTSLKAASTLYADDDGFYVKRQRLLVPNKKKGSINRPQYKLRAARDDNEEDFSGKIITKQAEFKRPEGESDTEQSHTNTIESGNQKRLASDIRRAGFAHKTDNNDVDHKQMLEEVVLITLADRERETQTEPEREVILNTDTGWKTVNIKELDDPPPVGEAIQGKPIIEPDESKCKCLKQVPFFKIYALARREGMTMKAAKSAAQVTTVSAHTEKQVTGETEETHKTTSARTSMNQAEREENVSSEDLVIPSTPLFKVMETEPATAAPVAETTAVNMEMKETTARAEVFSQTGTQKETPTSPESETEPRFIRRTTGNAQATTGKPASGLRMREDVLAGMTKVHEDRDRDGTENEGRASTGNPNVESVTDANPSQTIQAADQLPKVSLIHRTEAGWKHCLERAAGISSGEPADDAFKDPRERERTTSPVNDDEYDHFYYFDGVLKRVQQNFPPPKRRRGDSENGGLLHRYIHELVLKNKDENVSFISSESNQDKNNPYLQPASPPTRTDRLLQPTMSLSGRARQV
ncbi:hypothetical protein GBF38_009648 [Nibea albiflora]|uniref:Uncharacterized protein n=1 Tax=Nibea albiflora TaxID=240163 RepID=A0ACB7F8M3_NIBAL|nr:hypothetical protein GBF38_009648 [Nibea albiflora]